MDKIKVAKELVKLAKSLVAENDFEKRKRITEKIKELNKELEELRKDQEDGLALVDEYYNYLKGIVNPNSVIKKRIKNIENKKYHLIGDCYYEEGLKNDNPELYDKLKYFYFRHLSDFPKQEASLLRKINDYELSLKDIEHKLGHKMSLLTSKLPDDFEEAMEDLRKTCVKYIEENIAINIKSYKEILEDSQAMWKALSDEYNFKTAYVYNFDKENQTKIVNCKDFEDFKTKLMNGDIVYKTKGDVEQTIKTVSQVIDKVTAKTNNKIQFEMGRDAEQEGNVWYHSERLKLLGELATYCDDILSAEGLYIAGNGEFNVTVVSSNGKFRVLTSSVIGHYRWQGYGGVTWVRPHWRLTVKRVA